MSSAIERRRIVEEGYDLLDARYRDWVGQMRPGYRASFLRDMLRRVPIGSDVLEIGCGPGTDAAALAEDRHYTGLDLSSVQLEHARALVPSGTFLHADVLDVAFPPANFDAVIAFYVFNHIPADRMGELFGRIATWLRPGGWLCASFGTSDNPGAVEPAWLGIADMYFSSLTPETNDEALSAAGFSIESARAVTEIEPGEGPATFRWVFAQIPPPAGKGA